MGKDLKNCLSLETTGQKMGVSLVSFADQGRPRRLRESFEEVSSRQSELLIPLIDKLMKSAKIKKSQLSLIAVDIGPGSFTGVRVGLSVARALAQSLELPLVGVCALEAMAWTILQKQPHALVVPHLLAVTNEVYFAAYRGRVVVKKPAWEPESTLTSFLHKHLQAVTTSALPNPTDVAELAIARYQMSPKSAHFHYENVRPMYLMPSWAERSLRKA